LPQTPCALSRLQDDVGLQKVANRGLRAQPSNQIGEIRVIVAENSV